MTQSSTFLGLCSHSSLQQMDLMSAEKFRKEECQILEMELVLIDILLEDLRYLWEEICAGFIKTDTEIADTELAKLKYEPNGIGAALSYLMAPNIIEGTGYCEGIRFPHQTILKDLEELIQYYEVLVCKGGISVEADETWPSDDKYLRDMLYPRHMEKQSAFNLKQSAFNLYSLHMGKQASFNLYPELLTKKYLYPEHMEKQSAFNLKQSAFNLYSLHMGKQASFNLYPELLTKKYLYPEHMEKQSTFNLKQSAFNLYSLHMGKQASFNLYPELLTKKYLYPEHMEKPKPRICGSVLLVISTLLTTASFQAAFHSISTNQPEKSLFSNPLMLFISLFFIASVAILVSLLHEFPFQPWPQVTVLAMFASYMFAVKAESPDEAVLLFLISILLLLLVAAAGNPYGFPRKWLHKQMNI